LPRCAFSAKRDLIAQHFVDASQQHPRDDDAADFITATFLYALILHELKGAGLIKTVGYEEFRLTSKGRGTGVKFV
jgi:hypothetical protein